MPPVARASPPQLTEKLSAIGTAFRLNACIPGTVRKRFNPVSNTRRITMDDRFEGSVPAGGVTNPSGLALRALEAFIRCHGNSTYPKNHIPLKKAYLFDPQFLNEQPT